MDNINIIINESVYNGSIFLSFEAKSFTPQDLMNWLVNSSYSEKTLIAYKLLCIELEPNLQYLDDGFHFIMKQKMYIQIAIEYGLNLDNTLGQKGGSDPIINFVCDERIYINNNIEITQFNNLLLRGTGIITYVKSNLKSCFLARNFNHIRNFKPDEYNKDLVNADWIHKFRYNDNLAKLIIDRNILLKNIAPTYYKTIAYSLYYKVASKIYKDKLLSNIDKNDLVIFNEIFPGIIDTKILCYNNIGYKISLYSNEIAGYLLGYPINRIIPNELQIKNALSKLIDEGKEKYCEYSKYYNTKLYNQELPFCKNDNIQYANTTDVMLEDIDNYVPFDIVSYQVGTHIYRFSRVEYTKLLESNKNPWTNDFLPESILIELKNKLECAENFKLPPARPLYEMLDLLETNKLYENEIDTLKDNDELPLLGEFNNQYDDEFYELLFNSLSNVNLPIVNLRNMIW